MADQTKIEWTDATWNPITGCTLVDDGCRNCYAAELAATRLKHHPSRAGLARKNAAGVSKFTGEVRFNAGWLTQPLGWSKPRMIFVCAHGDLFHPAVPDDWIDRVFAVMALCPQHTFQVLTKRPERAQEYLDGEREGEIAAQADQLWNEHRAPQGDRGFIWFDNHPEFGPTFELTEWPLPNVWLGTSISDQASADRRIPHLLACPAAVRFVSAEPLLGPVDLTDLTQQCAVGTHHYSCLDLDGLHPDDDPWGGALIDWIIVGGESGRNARPMHPDWARGLRDQCQAAGTAFFFKQWGEWLPLGQGGFTHWSAATGKKGNRKDAGKSHSIGHAHFNDGAGGPETNRVGPIVTTHSLLTPGQFSGITSARVGKKAAGRLLDGREWNGVPG